MGAAPTDTNFLSFTDKQCEAVMFKLVRTIRRMLSDDPGNPIVERMQPLLDDMGASREGMCTMQCALHKHSDIVCSVTAWADEFKTPSHKGKHKGKRKGKRK